MAVQSFNDLYLGQCDHCGADLEDWEWLSDDMFFITTCTCGTEYQLEPTAGVLESEDNTFDDDGDEHEDE